MTQEAAPASVYEQQAALHSRHLQVLSKKRNRLGWLRLFVIIVAIAVTIKAFGVSEFSGAITLVAGIAAFLILVSIDVANNNRMQHIRQLLHINNEECEILKGNFQQRFGGGAFLPPVHPYAADLDIFGTSSLYQYINRGNSEQGRALLAQNLLTGISAPSVMARQHAVKEMAPQIEWRQHFQALMQQTPVSLSTQAKTAAWLNETKEPFAQAAWRYIVLLYSIITIASAAAALTGLLSPAVFSLLFIIYLAIATTFSSQATKHYTWLNGIVAEISTLSAALQWIEEKHFDAPLLNELQQSVRSGSAAGYGEIKKLKALLNRFDMRLNVYVFLFLNSFLLWDVRQMLSLNRWRRQNKSNVTNWFGAIAEMEVLHSLATLHFNQPQWSWPVFSSDHFTFSGTAIGHPLIEKDRCVTNDFALQGTGKVALITGSNMAGKSTFLRSMGVNLVLAQVGAPVCAKYFCLSPVALISSMRIADNLAESTSTFYAELKKLKTIIEAMKTGAPLLILLDEVLRGTNSLDRHIGLKALIRQIINEGSVAVIATHDVEVAKLETDYPDALSNYHFDVQVQGEELYFDYKLKHGVCTSLNASLLMKKIGIVLEENP